ncbi:MAG: hypothetical protein IKU23_06535 [Clostridia bacterium]|nr:hypothetical protein [Clostridia bacterium]
MKLFVFLLSCLLVVSLLPVAAFADGSAQDDVSHFIPDEGSDISQTQVVIYTISLIVIISVFGVLFAKSVIKNNSKNRLGRR